MMTSLENLPPAQEVKEEKKLKRDLVRHQGFDFGTSYVKKEVVPKQEGKAKRSMKYEVQSKKEESNQDAKQISSGSVENEEKSSKPTQEMKTRINAKSKLR